MPNLWHISFKMNSYKFTFLSWREISEFNQTLYNLKSILNYIKKNLLFLSDSLPHTKGCFSVAHAI